MTKKYSIGFLIGFVVAAFLAIMGMQLYKKQEQLDNTQIQKTQTEKIENGFCIKEENGYLSVYNMDKNCLFEETSILFEDLPYALKEQIKTGYYLKTEEEVYSFLENYSS